MVRTNAAARLLGVSANTLRSWERRYGFPRPQRTAGGHRQYRLDELEALKQALNDTQNVSSAVSLAQERGLGPSSRARLRAAFASFDESAADRLLEESLALRSIERTVEELLLPAVGDHAEWRGGAGGATPAYEFAWRHATGWLWAQRRLAPLSRSADGVLILDPWTTCDLDSLHTLALELVLHRAGLATLSLSPATHASRLGQALRALRPRAVVLAGGSVSLDQVARLVYAIRGIVPEVMMFDYRGAIPDSGASMVVRLGDTPLAARDVLLASLRGGERPPRRLSLSATASR
jgi:DNA-binding transcriptional MerR regulator